MMDLLIRITNLSSFSFLCYHFKNKKVMEGVQVH